MILKSILLATALALVLTTPSDEEQRVRGMAVTDSVQRVLLSNVQKAIKAGGPPTAVAFCNTMAMPLTDSLARAHNVDIRRTSLKYRNSSNAPSTHESRVLNRLDFANDKGQLPPSILETINDTLHFYRPILVAKPCLACHGEPGTDISNETMAVLRDAYPNDLATGYKEGDLRGMWHLVFKAE